MNAPIIEARNLTRHYKVGGGLFQSPGIVKAMDGASFTLGSGQDPCSGWRIGLRQVDPGPGGHDDRGADQR